MDAVSKIIKTVAGNGQIDFSGDGGPATAAALDSPGGIAVGAAGNLFIADTGNHRIRSVDAVSQVIKTVAGNNSIGYFRDDLIAITTSLNSPRGIALDTKSNLFIADTLNHRIRKVDAAGIITTVAGKGLPGFSGDGGQATTAFLDSPEGIAVDATGNLFIADSGNHRIRRVDATGKIVTVAGSDTIGSFGDRGPATAAGLRIPAGIALDKEGNLFIADKISDRIRAVRGPIN